MTAYFAASKSDFELTKVCMSICKDSMLTYGTLGLT